MGDIQKILALAWALASFSSISSLFVTYSICEIWFWNQLSNFKLLLYCFILDAWFINGTAGPRWLTASVFTASGSHWISEPHFTSFNHLRILLLKLNFLSSCFSTAGYLQEVHLLSTNVDIHHLLLRAVSTCYWIAHLLCSCRCICIWVTYHSPYLTSWVA